MENFSSEYYWFAFLLEIAEYPELLFNYKLTIMTSRSKRGLQIIAMRGFTSSNPAFLGFHKYL